ALAHTWLGLAIVPLMGSFITEPAAMTLAALMLAPLAFKPQVPERAKYLALGALFVNVSIGGTPTSFSAPPVLMVAARVQWDTAHMLSNFGWKAAIAVVVNASVATFALRSHLAAADDAAAPREPAHAVPWPVPLIHLALLAGVVALEHHPVAFLGL